MELDEKQLKKLSMYLISNKQLTVDGIMRISRPLGILFSMVEVIIRKYSSAYLGTKAALGSASSSTKRSDVMIYF